MFAAKLPLTEGLAVERATFIDLMGSSQSRALRHSFFAEREVMRVPGLDDVARHLKGRDQETLTLGMGSGMGVLIAVPYTHILIETLGWQSSLLVLAYSSRPSSRSSATCACLCWPIHSVRPMRW